MKRLLRNWKRHIAAVVGFVVTMALVVYVTWLPFRLVGVSDTLAFFFGGGAVLAGLGCIYVFMGGMTFVFSILVVAFTLLHLVVGWRAATRGDFYVYPFALPYFKSSIDDEP